MGIVMSDFLNKKNIQFTNVSPFAKDVGDYDLLIVGGGHILRESTDSFYNNFRVWGRHILNTVDVTNAQNLQYLKDYKYISVRSTVAANKLRKHKVNAVYVPDICINMQGKNTAVKIPSDSIGVHFMEGRGDMDISKHIKFVKDLAETNSVVLIPFTHYANDYAYLKKIHTAVPKTVLLENLEPQVLFDTIGKLKMLVSMSLHATIFAYSQNVNFIVSEEPKYKKIGSFLKDRGMQHRIYTDNMSLTKKTKYYINNKDTNFNKKLNADKLLLRKHFAKILDIINNLQPQPELVSIYSSLTSMEREKYLMTAELEVAQNKIKYLNSSRKIMAKELKQIESTKSHKLVVFLNKHIMHK